GELKTQTKLTVTTGSTPEPCEEPTQLILQKRVVYQQTNGLPVIDPDTPPAFIAQIDEDAGPSASGAVIEEASFQVPSDPPQSIVFTDSDFEEGEFAEHFETPAALDFGYPGGTYRVVLTTDQGSGSANVEIPGNAWPPVPRFLNLSEAQQIDPLEDFTVRWNEFPGGDSNRATIFILSRQVLLDGETNWFPVVLAGAATCENPTPPPVVSSFTVSNTLLQTNQVYRAELIFVRQTGEAVDVAGVEVKAGYLNHTRAEFRTIGGSAVSTDPPTISSVSSLGDGKLKLRVECQPGQELELRRTAKLGSAWETLTLTNAIGNSVEFIASAVEALEFFKVELSP
ncbi:MAG TPA: hypothetical protein PLX89_15575, partial [Verrucomicrobiota bacterium]|nr:hypothetical protein [Verrucomicrobiota bacterium]